MQLYTLIFDIGKTNKKCLLFDSNFAVIEKQESTLAETVDEGGFPCEDIQLLTAWIREMYDFFNQKYTNQINAINFSTYGASFVHLSDNQEVILPVYNYLKPVSDGYFDAFYTKYGTKNEFSKTTSSPTLDFLNSGLQLYWIQQEKPIVFEQIKTSLHFPNYCSFLFHGKMLTEYTSLGCHTGLWDFEKMNYHKWVEAEDIAKKLPEIVKGTAQFPNIQQKEITVGVGLHDSSAALVPYLFGVKEKFILISTGTWSITLNPFNTEVLTANELTKDCLEFLTVKGEKVKASRLFLGNEFAIQIKALNKYFDKQDDDFTSILFQHERYTELVNTEIRSFYFESLGEENKKTVNTLANFKSFEAAYYQLCYELVQQQITAYYLAKGNTKNIKSVFIDGGFAKNDIFCSILALMLPDISVKKTNLAAGSSLGAAIIMHPEQFTTTHFNTMLDVKPIKN